MTDVVVFAVRESDPPRIVPEVNGRSLIDLVTDFETGRRYQPAGGYGGLVPAYFRFGDLPQYYLGREPKQWPKPGRAWLLGCDCGEVGCWPLEASIDADGDRVIWRDYRQPDRPDRDYRSFGPFVFPRNDYDQAIRAAIAALHTSTG